MSKKIFLKKYCIMALVALLVAIIIVGYDDSGNDSKKNVATLLLLTSFRNNSYMNVTIASVGKNYADRTAGDMGSAGLHKADGSITSMISSPFYIGGSSTGTCVINEIKAVIGQVRIKYKFIVSAKSLLNKAISF